MLAFKVTRSFSAQSFTRWSDMLLMGVVSHVLSPFIEHYHVRESEGFADRALVKHKMLTVCFTGQRGNQEDC